MFLRALQQSPDLFGSFHVMHNATIGAFPPEIAKILAVKGGALLAYHEVDPDHMREAVCYKALTELMQQQPKLCRYVDNELARAAGDPDHMNVRLWPGRPTHPITHRSSSRPIRR